MSAHHNERRQGDRRSAARRRHEGPPGLPGSFSDDPPSGGAGGDEPTGAHGATFFDPGWLAAGDAPGDSRFVLRQARRAALVQDSALARVFRTYTAARAVIGVGLVATQSASNLWGQRGSELMALLCVVYAVQAVTLWLLPRFGSLAQPQVQVGQRQRQWLATVGVDLVAFSALHVVAVGSSPNYAALLVLPVLMAGVLTSRLLALATAAGVSLMLLLTAWHSSLNSGEAPALILQSGLGGLGLFVIALLAGELAGRLARETLAARASLELARQQAQLNRLVIEELVDGVLVVDGQLKVRAANPAARALLVAQGLSPPAPFSLADRAVWSNLRQAAERALLDGDWPEAGREVSLAFADGHERTLRLRVRFVRERALDPATPAGAALAPPSATAGEALGVLLLEDVRTAQARIRQEKLAAMGRVSAGIAHEIRNPLAAISQANALMMEDDLPPPQQRLARMVANNVERLKRLVDDVMEVAPGTEPPQSCIDASAVVAAAITDWAGTVQMALGADSRLRTDVAASALGVMFDPEHLRRVLVNLLDNAQRHASGTAGSMFLRLAGRDEHWVVLSVLSDGPPITPDVERYLFEPFFSTRSRGSGLGLYICRELCERYGASIEYRPRPTAEKLRNEFVVSMRRVAPIDGLPSAPTLNLES